MYSYTYDKKTGGIILNSSPTAFSKEPRPVYAAELDILGFDKYWTYDKQNDIPYMWAEANTYWYRGICVAKLKGGSISKAPEIIIPCDDNGHAITPEAHGTPLRPIDMAMMLEKNADFISILEQTTVKKIVAIYEKYVKKVDLFHVAYSGGKDSAVLLDLVKKALPHGSFVVIFGDTGMEFPDTYDNIEATKLMCEKEDIPFYTARSHLTPEQSWRMFGPPSRVLRWCCSVHKSAPQMLKLREITGKNDYIGLAFVGVRLHESVTRAQYTYENFGKKQKGQYSHNSILEWTSAEVWLYHFTHGITINTAYIKGNSRAGCLLCPMSVRKSDFIKSQIYSKEMQGFINIIHARNGRNYGDNSYIFGGGWVSRRSGRDLLNNEEKYLETTTEEHLKIEIKHPTSKWQEWIKTLKNYEDLPFSVTEHEVGYTVVLPRECLRTDLKLSKYFKQVFRKSAFCINCGTCEANCVLGRLKLYPKIEITHCTHCLKCHAMEDGCYVYQSLRMPQGEKSMSINSFDTTLPKTEWFQRFFELGNDFWDAHGLGPNQIKTFKTFLRHAELIDKTNSTPLVSHIKSLGWDTNRAWGIILTNLAANNPQMRWYILNFDLLKYYPKEDVLVMLKESTTSANVAKNVCRAFAKLLEVPLGTVLNFGSVNKDGSYVRTKCTVSDPHVVLYALFKFAEKCNDYKEFTLSTLMDDSIDRDGISPSRIFGLTREDLIPMLIGLNAKYPDFISATFTHDLEKIALAKDKNSTQVLDLFMEE